MNRYLTRYLRSFFLSLTFGFGLFIILSAVFSVPFLPEIEAAAAGVLFMMLGTLLAFFVLYDGFRSGTGKDELEFEIRQSGREAIGEINRRASEFYTQLTDEKIREIVKEQISDEAIGELVATTDRAVWDKYLDRRIEREIEALRDNLTQWLVSVRRSALFNYLVALAFASLGVFAAATFFLPGFAESPLRTGANGAPDLTRDILFVLVPKTILVVAFELVAIHFFRLHQSGQATVRYIRDEINTLRFKTTAFYAALKNDDKEFQNAVIKDLLSVERQRIMSAGETTIGLERERLNQVALTEVMAEMGRLQTMVVDLVRRSEKSDPNVKDK